MKQLPNILTVLLFSLTLVSCGQSKNTKQDNKVSETQSEKKYTKVISDPTNKLTDKVESLLVNYHVIGCACPNWIRITDEGNNDTTKKFKDLYFYIEPADKTLELPIYFDPSRHSLNIRGQFYEREDYPQGTIEMEEPMPKAKVFRYTKIEVIDKPAFNPDTKIETLILNYNAISCTCAQWSEPKYHNNPDKRVYYWLEPSSDKLIKAHTLFNGLNLPVQIKVTGQIVSENGFPKRNLSKVRQDEAGKVFRYTKIEVLKNGQKKNGY